MQKCIYQSAENFTNHVSFRTDMSNTIIDDKYNFCLITLSIYSVFMINITFIIVFITFPVKPSDDVNERGKKGRRESVCEYVKERN